MCSDLKLALIAVVSILVILAIFGTIVVTH